MPNTITNEQYLQLVEQLNKWSQSYYNDAVSLVTDAEFDREYDKLKQIEQEHPDWVVDNSPTQRVGAPVEAQPGDAIAHFRPMLSLSKTRTAAEVQKFVTRCQNAATGSRPLFYVDDKLDGLSCELKYDNGELIYAATRGDGLIGQNVTEVACNIPNISRRICHQGYVYIRGEVVVHKSVFCDLNAEIEKKGGTKFSNTRNYATGCLTAKNKDPVASGKTLRFYAWELVIPGKSLTHSEQMEILNELGFSQPHGQFCHDISEIMAYINKVAVEREFLPYDIDGMVIKVDDPELRAKLGANRHDVLWATAWKFQSRGAPTTIKSIIWNVGRTGKLTPVVNIEPIIVDGVRINMVNGHNATTVENWGIGSEILVVRSGDVIPRVQEVIKSSGKCDIPAVCPYCQQPLTRISSDIYCTNPDCKAIFKAWLKYIVHRDVLDIKGIGESFIDDAVDTGSITKFEDLFVTVDNKSENLRDSDFAMLTSRMREINLFELLLILNVGGIGRAVAAKLAMMIKSCSAIDSVLSSPEKVRRLTVSSSVQNNLLEWYANPRHREMIAYVLSLHLPKLQ